MYAESIVEERLALASAELGWVPEYHSVSDVDHFDSKLRANYGPEYQIATQESLGSQDPTRTFQQYLQNSLNNPNAPKLSKSEAHWIENENVLCACDAAYWMTRYYFIKNKENNIQRFSFQDAQKIYFNIVSELEARRAAIEILAAKARQLGVSTVTEGLITHRILFSYGVNVTIASADQSKTSEMAKMLFLGYDMLPWWMRPNPTRRVESDRGMLMFGGQRSGVVFQHGTQTGGISQGTTPTVYHLSEVAYYPNPEALIEVGLFKAVHKSPKVLGILESTAAGDTGWWPDTYWFSKSHWPRARMFAMFLPWITGTDMYPNPTWLRTAPIPRDWRPIQETLSMKARAELYVASNPVLEKVMGKGWRLPQEQAWWWEVNYQEALAKRKEKLFYQEYPTDDRESFQGSYDNVFGREVIAEVYTTRRAKYDVYGIVGQSIEDRHEPKEDEIDWSKPRIPVHYKSNKGDTYRWELVPILWKERWSNLEDLGEDDSWEGKLFVFHPPEADYDYSMGVDTSSGIGSDSTCIAMARRARGNGEPDVQAAEFRSSTVSHVEAFAFGICIAAYYSHFMPNANTPHKEPYVSVEQVAAVGDTCQLQMRKMGYGRFHRMTRYDGKDISKTKSRKMGWYTNVWSRPMLTDGFVIAVQNGWYVVNSPWTVWEMDHWEVHLTGSGKEKKEHSSEATDDGIFANAMATFCPNDLKTLTERTKKRRLGTGPEELPAIDLGKYNGIVVASSTRYGTLDAPKRDWEMDKLLG